MNCFFKFSKEMRPKLKAENPGIKPRELARLLGKKWYELSKEEKDEWRNKEEDATEGDDAKPRDKKEE